AIGERLGEAQRPQVIINRFEQRMFGAGLRKSDVEQALSKDFVAAVPNNYALVRGAIDRGVPLEEGKPGNQNTAAPKQLIAPPPHKAAAKEAPAKKLAPA